MKRTQIVAATIAALAVLSGGAFYLRSSSAETQHEVLTWDECSGRLEQARAVSSASRSTALSGSRYRAGYVSQLELLDAQRSELRNRRQALQVRSDRYQSTVALVRALGGSW